MLTCVCCGKSCRSIYIISRSPFGTAFAIWKSPMATDKITLAEASVAASVAVLKSQGFDLDLLTACTDNDIGCFVPDLLTPVQALKLKIALRHRRSKEFNDNLYKSLLCFVGIVDVSFEDGSTQSGNVVLIGEQGLCLTALHVLIQEADGEEGSSSKGRAKVVKRGVKDIWVSFPNTSEGLLRYKAVVVHRSDTDDDLALLKAVGLLLPQFRAIRTLLSWPPYLPQEGDKVFLISFPAGKGEQVRICHNPSGGDYLPWYAQGAVTCVDLTKVQAFADYSSFGGSSGALVVHPLPNEGGYKASIHLGTYHESEVLAKWNRSELDNLNVSLGQKAYNGYFSLKVGAFINSYFQPNGAGGKVLQKYLHHQVVVRRVKKTPKRKRDEAVEEVDLFGPWAGLDDNVDLV